MVVMRRCLVVANRTLLSAELREELRQRIESGPSSFYVLVPNTSAADYQIPADSGVLPPSLAWWATNYRGPATDEEASAQARQRLGETLASILHGCDVLAWWAGRPAFLILVSGVRRGVPARLSRRVGAGSTAGCGSLLSGWLGWGGRVMAGAGP